MEGINNSNSFIEKGMETEIGLFEIYQIHNSEDYFEETFKLNFRNTSEQLDNGI